MEPTREKKNSASKWDLVTLDNSMAAFGRDIRFIFKHHALEYMGPTNELDVTLSGKGWLLFKLAVHAPSTPERVGISRFGLQRKNKVDDFAPAQTSR